MKRRSFLGFLGGAVASGPSAAKVAAEATINDLSLSKLGVAGGSGDFYPISESLPESDTDWAKQRLKEALGLSAQALQRQKRSTRIVGLDPNIAACRSMSLVTKVRLSRDIEFSRQRRDEIERYEGVIAGWWS